MVGLGSWRTCNDRRLVLRRKGACSRCVDVCGSVPGENSAIYTSIGKVETRLCVVNFSRSGRT
jgi:hypothetical protein